MVLNRIGIGMVALVGAGLAIGKPSGAQAPIVQTFTVPTGSAVPFSDPFTFNLFNTSLGTLNSVTLALNATTVATVDIFNPGGTNVPYTNAGVTVPIQVSGPDSVTVSTTAVAGPFAGSAPPGLTQFVGVPGSGSSSLSVPTADFGQYSGVGGGTGTLTGASSTANVTGSGVGLIFGGTATAGEVVTLTYNYSQKPGTLPEPGVATFFAAGVLGSLGMMIRRRKRI